MKQYAPKARAGKQYAPKARAVKKYAPKGRAWTIAPQDAARRNGM